MSNKVFSGDFLKVLLALKDSIMKDIHCSELAVIKEVYNNNCNCSLLSNSEIKINAYRTKGTICRVGDIVLVAFSDNDFRSNLLKKDNGSQLQAIDSPVKHQLDYGIIVSNLTIGFGSGTKVKFIDDAINITNLSNLDLNRLSEQKLDELKDSGLLSENALYMTPDVSEDETKANTDASNLTEENVASWKDKLKVGKLITDYTLSSESNSINITGLDLIAHGGVYEIECELNVNTGADVNVRVNNITETNYDTLTISSYIGSNQSITVGGGINVSSFSGSVIQPKGAILSFKLIQNSTNSAEYLFNNFSADSSNCYYRCGGGRVTTTSTVSSIQIVASQPILSGARIKIYAREK